MRSATYIYAAINSFLESSDARVYALLIKNGLPQSFRRGDGETAAFLISLMGLSKRQLLQRMETLMAETANLPPTIEERLATCRNSCLIGYRWWFPLHAVGASEFQVIDTQARMDPNIENQRAFTLSP